MNPPGNTSATWAIVVIVIVPIAILAAAELDERLRQRESPLRSAAVMIRNWALPFFALWALLGPVLGVDSDSFAVRVVSTGLLLSLALATQRAIGVVIDRTRRHMDATGRRSAPELLLLLPRLAVIIAVGWLLIETIWGVDLSAALTALGVTSLVISFALQDTLSGLASGLLLLSDQPIEPGHWVRVGDIEGVVVDINWRTTRIRDRNGDLIIVPNSELAGSSIVNYSTNDPVHRVVVSVQVAFVNPPTLAKAMLLDAALSTAGVLSEPPPQAVVTQIDDPMMGYDVHMWIDDYAIAPRVESEFGALVWYQSHRHDVPLPSPAQDLFLHDGATAGADGRPTHAELRRSLEQSPLLASLGDEALDRLAHAGRAARYAVGERITDSADDGRDLVVLSEGRADLIVGRAGQAENVVAELASGEIGGLLSDSVEEQHLWIRAVTDCEVVIIDVEAVEQVASRSTELAAALNRLSAVRRRRAERMMARDPVALNGNAVGGYE
jgi:small-conductance mechanosensitive channel